MDWHNLYWLLLLLPFAPFILFGMSSAAGANYANGSLTNDIVATPATAQTALTGVTTATAGMVLVAAGTVNGKRINRASWMPTAAWAGGVILWWYNPSGTTAILIAATSVPAVTPSTTVPPSKTPEPTLVGFNLPNTTNLYASSELAVAGVAIVEGANY